MSTFTTPGQAASQSCHRWAASGVSASRARTIRRPIRSPGVNGPFNTASRTTPAARSVSGSRVTIKPLVITATSGRPGPSLPALKLPRWAARIKN